MLSHNGSNPYSGAPTEAGPLCSKGILVKVEIRPARVLIKHRQGMKVSKSHPGIELPGITIALQNIQADHLLMMIPRIVNGKPDQLFCIAFPPRSTVT